MRLSFGDYRTFSVVSLYVQVSKPSLNDRILALACAYVFRITERTQHLCYPIVTTCHSRTLFTNGPQSTRSLLLRFEEMCHKLNLLGRLLDTAQNHVALPRWYSFPSVFDLTLTQFNKRQTPREYIIQAYFALKEKHDNYTLNFSQMVRKPQLTSEVQYWRGTGKQWQDFRSVRQYLLLSVTLSW